MIAGFLAQGYSTVESVLLGNGLHGLAGQLVEEKLDITSTTASDVIEHIGVAIRNLRSLQIT
jgi:NAD(P)H-hydrate repair Nnr-like enzyme with NAD(P)H-hydrate dehydratase domain